MQPTCIDIIRSSVANLEELVIPDIQDPHARSAALCIRTLLNHVTLRLEKGDQHLAEDSREKRQLLSSLADLGADLGDSEATSVRIALADAKSSAEQVPAAIALVTTEQLSAENDALRQLVIDILKVIKRDRSVLSPAAYDSLMNEIRAQLRREAARDNETVLIDGPLF